MNARVGLGFWFCFISLDQHVPQSCSKMRNDVNPIHTGRINHRRRKRLSQNSRQLLDQGSIQKVLGKTLDFSPFPAVSR